MDGSHRPKGTHTCSDDARKLDGEEHANDIDDDTVELVELPTARDRRLSRTMAAALAYGAPR
jgi:hypothetical protein